MKGLHYSKGPLSKKWGSLVTVLALVVSFVLFALAFQLESVTILFSSFGVLVLLVVVEYRSLFWVSLKEYVVTIRKLTWKFIPVVVFDLLTYAVSILVVGWSVRQFSLVLIDFNTMMADEITAQTLEGVRNSGLAALGYIILMVALVLLVWTIGKGTVWGIAQEKKLNFPYFFRLLGLNVMLFVTLFLVMYMMSLVLNTQSVVGSVIVLLVLLVIVYMGMQTYAAFDGTALRALAKGIHSLRKFHAYVIPALVALLVYLLLMILISPVSLLTMPVQVLIVLIVSVIYGNVARMYFLHMRAKIR